MDPVWKGHKEDGPHPTWFVLDDLDGFMVHLGQWAPGEPLELIVRKPRRPSSTPQLRYYWGVVLRILSDETGHTQDELHWHFKSQFLGVKGDDRIMHVPSLTELSTSQMEEYVEAIRSFAALNLECRIPMPNEVDYATQENNEEGGAG